MQENKVRVVFEAVLDNFNSNVKSAAKTTLGLGDAGEKASKSVNFDESARSTNRLNEGLKKVDNTLRKTIETVVSLYTAKKLFDKTKENFEYFMDFEKGMAEVFTLLPELSGQARERMADDVKQFAIEMKTLPEEVVPALYQAISASVPESKVFDFLKIARMASKGGITDLETSVDVLTSIVNAYGSDVINATEASDLMFMSMKKGKTTFEEMASNMYSVLPIAKSLQVPFENVTAAISTMTAMGTPTAQATTQIGRMFLEFSKDGTRASEIFLEATGRTFKQFIAEGNNVQDALMIMEEVAKNVGVEINNLFNSAEAGNAALALTGKGTQKFSEDLKAMENSAGATEEAYKEMDSTIASSVEGIKARMKVFALEVANQYSPQIRNAIEQINNSLDRAAQDGSLDRLAQSLGNLVATIISLFDRIIQNIDRVISAVDRMANFISTVLPGAISVIKRLAKAFLMFWIIRRVNRVVSTLIDSLKILIDVTHGARIAQELLNIAMLKNPITWVIFLIGLLIGWLIKLTIEFGNLKNGAIAAFEYIKIGFLYLVEAFMWGIDKIVQGIDFLLGWIPLIGDATEWTAKKTSAALAGIDSAINNSINNLDRLKKSAYDTANYMSGLNKKDLYLDPNIPIPQQIGKTPLFKPPKLSSVPKAPKMSIPKNISSKGLKIPKAPKTKRKKTIDERIREVEERSRPSIELYESRIELAEAREDDKKAKEGRRGLVKALRKQANDLLFLQKKTKGQDAKLVEAARNKTLAKIEKTIEEINDKVTKMIGEFNIPSELKTLTKYQYQVEKSNDKLSKRFIYSPNIKMYLNIDDLKDKGIEQTKDELEHFTQSIFGDKDNLVVKFMQDATRN